MCYYRRKAYSNKKIKRESTFRTFTIRLNSEIVDNINDLAKQSNRSRNEIIKILFEYAIDKCEIKIL
ncbi:MAG: ribbon-helix-helix protein, CopG family [Eubacterium sp.]